MLFFYLFIEFTGISLERLDVKDFTQEKVERKQILFILQRFSCKSPIQLVKEFYVVNVWELPTN